MVDKADQGRQKPKAPLDQCGAGGSDSEIKVTPQMVADFERILRETGIGYDKAFWIDDLAEFIRLFRDFQESHGLSRREGT